MADPGPEATVSLTAFVVVALHGARALLPPDSPELPLLVSPMSPPLCLGPHIHVSLVPHPPNPHIPHMFPYPAVSPQCSPVFHSPLSPIFPYVPLSPSVPSSLCVPLSPRVPHVPVCPHVS